VLVSTAALAAVLVPALAGAQAPQRSVTLSASQQLIKFNTTTSTLSGQLMGVQKPANVRITLQRATFPYQRFRALARLRTDATGSFSFTVAPAVNTQYRVVAATKPALQSATVGVLVLPQVTIKLSSGHPRAGHPLRVSGYVYPKENRAGVELQFARTANWRVVRTGQTYDVGGSVRSGYSFVLAAPHLPQRVRVVVTQSNSHAPSASHQRALRPR
jgi:hypothetical protein